MNIDRTLLKQRMDQFQVMCRESGVKLTHQRLEIFREIARTGDHPHAESIHKRVKKRLPTVSLDTVYRTLWLLKDMGLIETLGANHERTRFDANLEPHHHFICKQCGLTLDFYSRDLDKIQLPDSLESIGTIEAAQVEVRGICNECISKERSINIT